MSSDEVSVGSASSSGTARSLRRLFDATFSAPAELRRERAEHLLAIRVDAHPYVLRLPEVAGLHADLQVVPVPSPAVHLLGIVGLRGVMAPVYDLAGLLGHPRAANPRWVVFARAPELVGFAFEAFDSHLQVADESLATAEQEAGSIATGAHVRGAIRAAGVLRPIIRLASLVATLKGYTHDR
jgi:chemotaxis signal transduction protein